MKVINYLKKIPYLSKKIKRIKPSLFDILFEFYKKYDKLIIIDVGANIGQTINMFKNEFPNSIIHSFEPTPEIYSLLYKKYFSLDNVFLYNIALSNENKPIDFYTSDYSPTNSCLKPNLDRYKGVNPSLFEKLSKSKRIKIDACRFDDWIKGNFNSDIIHLFKIDVQGFEYSVIEGAIETLTTKTRMIYLEIQFQNFYFGSTQFYKLFELLYNNDFYLFNYFPSYIGPKYQLLESDVLFFNRKFFKE